jgi:hypothetical protein
MLLNAGIFLYLSHVRELGFTWRTCTQGLKTIGEAEPCRIKQLGRQNPAVYIVLRVL